jgi:hypothetical protein
MTYVGTVSPCKDDKLEKKHVCTCARVVLLLCLTTRAQPFTFEVSHPVRRTFYMQATSAIQRDEWISVIQVRCVDAVVCGVVLTQQLTRACSTKTSTGARQRSNDSSYACCVTTVRRVCDDSVDEIGAHSRTPSAMPALSNGVHSSRYVGVWIDVRTIPL